MTKLSQEALAEIQAMVDAATPGPWHRYENVVVGPHGETIITAHTGMSFDLEANDLAVENARLVERAPEIIPQLLSHISALEDRWQLHRGDTLSLDNEATLMHEQRDEANDRCREVQDKLSALETQRDGVIEALRYVIKVRNIVCKHPHPAPDEFCAKCIADNALANAEVKT